MTQRKGDRVLTFDTTLLHSLIYEYHALQCLAGLLYAWFTVGLLSLGFRHHDSVTKGGTQVGQFPRGYFAALVWQLLPMTLTGVIIADGFIVTTRILTLVVVLLVFALATSPNGLDTARNRLGALFWIGGITIVALLWIESPLTRAFVTYYETLISWSIIGLMFLFLVKGQWSVAKELYHHFIDGNYTVKRLSLQFVRLVAFLAQALHYWLMPSAAAPLPFGIDPVFAQGAMGAVGVLIVLLSAGVGWLRGADRREHKLAARPA